MTLGKVALKAGVVRLVSSLHRDDRGLRVLMYHSVSRDLPADREQTRVPLHLFEAQMAYLRENGHDVQDAATAVASLRAGQEPRARSLVITFDDGHADTHETALPILQRHSFPATVFVLADALTAKGLRGAIGISQAREMLSTGLVRFGCHGATHRALVGLTDRELRDETAGARARIEDALGVSVTLFAYPFGLYDAWDARALAAVRSAGFDAAFSTIVGANGRRTDRFRLRRSRVSWAEELPLFRRLLTGGYDWYAAIQWLQSRRIAALRARRPGNRSSLHRPPHFL